MIRNADEAERLFGDIRPEGSNAMSDAEKYRKMNKDKKKAMALATGEALPRQVKPPPKPKSIVNRVTEYGALFNKLNEAHEAKGLPPLKTAMEVLIEAMQSDELDLKDKAKIAEKLATFESSRAPVITIEHIQNVQKDEETDSEGALDDFLEALRKV